MADPSWLSAGATPSTSQAASKPTFKVILVGEVGVGKTTLFSRVCHSPEHEQRESRTHATIGVDTCTRTISTRCGHGTVSMSRWRDIEPMNTVLLIIYFLNYFLERFSMIHLACLSCFN